MRSKPSHHFLKVLISILWLKPEEQNLLKMYNNVFCFVFKKLLCICFTPLNEVVMRYEFLSFGFLNDS